MANNNKIIYQIGYYGKASLNSNPILATGGNITINLSPIYSSGIWGANIHNITQKIAYAPNYATMQGSVSFQLTQGSCSNLGSWAFTNRRNGGSLTILPDGNNGYNASSAYCTGFSFSASQDSLVTGQANFKTGDVNSVINSTATTVNSVIDETYTQVIPFYRTSVSFVNNSSGNNSLLDALDWNASYSSDLILVKTCDGTTYDSESSSNLLQAKYCCLGSMQASGSLTFLQLQDFLNPKNIRKHRKCTIIISTQYTISLPCIVIESVSTSVQTGSNLIQSQVSFTALGNSKGAPMSFIG